MVDPQTQQALNPAVQTIAVGLQMLMQQVGGAATGPGSIAGGLNGVLVNGALMVTPPVAPPTTYVAYKPLPADAYIVNADGVGRTAINPLLLSKPADVLRLMSAFAAAGYTILGSDVVANKNEVYPSDAKQYIINVKEHSQPINVGQAMADEFRSGVGPDGNPHSGKWVLTDGAQNIFAYESPATVDPWSTKGTVVAL